MNDGGALASEIVLVDDEPIILSALSALLDLEGYTQVHCFESGPTALDHIAQHSADLVISDMLMPRMDGIDVLREVRRLDTRIPRVLLTGYADKESAMRAVDEAGLCDYVEKPWCNKHLLRVVHNALRRRSRLRGLSPGAAELDLKRNCLRELRALVLRGFS